MEKQNTTQAPPRPDFVRPAGDSRGRLTETQRQAIMGPSIEDAADLIATPFDPPLEIVSGILHRGSKLVLGGGSKTCKTWTLLDLAVSLAHGSDWLGRETIKGRVLFVNLEVQKPFFTKRIEQVAAAKSLEIQRGQLSVLNLRGHCAGFEKVLPLITTAATQDAAFDLIILDPIYKLYGNTDENSAGDVAKLLNAIEALTVETGAAVAFGAHFSKGNQAGKQSMDRISGSGVFARDPDSILVLTAHEEEGAFTLDATLRNLPPVTPFVVRWDFPLMRTDEKLDPAKLKQAPGRTKQHADGDAMALLPADGLPLAEWQKAAEGKGISARTFYRLKKSLLAADRIRFDKEAKRWLPA